jgi:phosphoglycolate phosphatase
MSPRRSSLSVPNRAAAGSIPAPDPVTAVLFDIDGTLLDVRGAGRKSFVRALEAVFGWKDDIAYVDFAGNTDLNVLLQVMRFHKRPLTAEDGRRFFRQLPRELDQTAAEAELILYPGVRALLERLSADPRVVLALVTGNVEVCARIKLRQFDLHNHFMLGAFGDEHADRGAIARLAFERVRASLPPDRDLTSAYLIGDTPYDVAAARSIGAVAIAVATGKFRAAALQATGADHVLTDLSDTVAVLRLLGLAPRA